MWNLLLNAFVKYVESHPEVIDKLVEEGIAFLLSKINPK